MNHEVATNTVKSSVAVAGTAYAWLTLNEWVALATLVYITVQIIVLVQKHYLFLKDRWKK